MDSIILIAFTKMSIKQQVLQYHDAQSPMSNEKKKRKKKEKNK